MSIHKSHVHPQEIDAAHLRYGGFEYRLAVTKKRDTETVFEMMRTRESRRVESPSAMTSGQVDMTTTAG